MKYTTADEIIESFSRRKSERNERSETSSKRVPGRLQTGKEFINKKFQNILNKFNIHWFSTNSDLKASIV
jgi:hypothetical protein